MQTKMCTTCLMEKEICDFNRDKKGKYKVGSVCKVCWKNYREENKEHIRQQSAKRRANNSEQIKIEKAEYYQKNKKKIREKMAIYYKENKHLWNEYQTRRRLTDPHFRIMQNLRNNLSSKLRSSNVRKTSKTIDILGCCIEDFIYHLESLWSENMSWDNYGVYKIGQQMTWHIDHIKPCDSFDLTDEAQQRECFHYENMQPMWAVENIIKSNSY